MTYLRLCLGALLVSGCGLIDSNVSDIDLTLRDKSFSVDASGWQVSQMQADAFLNTACTGGSTNVCTAAASTACPMNCTGVCGSTNRCELYLDVSVYKGIDLLAEQPELKTINDKPIIQVTVDSVTYAVMTNSLNVATPVLGVYVAPVNVMDPHNPMATKIGTIQAVPAGTTVASRDMMYVDGGKEALIEIMSTYKNPFNVIVGTPVPDPLHPEEQLVVKAGDPLPMGRLDAVIQIKAHAGI